MTDWTKKAKVLFTKRQVPSADIVNKSLLISEHGENFHANVQTAADAKKPCMLFYTNDPEPMIPGGLDPKKWADHTNVNLQAIINDVMAGGLTGSRRTVHGVMINCSKVWQSDGKKITAQWITESAAHLGGRVKALLGLPVWYYMDMNPIRAFKGDQASLEVLYQFILKTQGIATVDWVDSDANGYPLANEKPALPYDNGNPWSFWFYHLEESTDIDVLYTWEEKQLWLDLGFTGGTTAGTGGSGGTSAGQTGGTVGFPAEVVPLLQRIAVASEGMSDDIASLRNWLKKN